jgi:hypothetical protein
MNHLDKTTEMVVIAYPQDWHWALSLEYQYMQRQNGIHVDLYDFSYLGEYGLRSIARRILGGNYLRKISKKEKRVLISQNYSFLPIALKALLKTIQDFQKLPRRVVANDFQEIYNSCVEKSGNLILIKSNFRSIIWKELYSHHLTIESLNKIGNSKNACVVTVNGRFTKNASILKWAENKGIPSRLVEFGAGKEKFETYEVSPHSMEELEQKIARYWEISDPVFRESVGRSFLKKLAENKPVTDIHWRIRMKEGSLPSLTKSKVCTFFASTETEYAGVGDIIPNGKFQNQVEAFRAIVDFLPSSEWQIVLRRHPSNPNDNSVDPEAFLWDEFKSRDNVIVVEPESVVDSMALGLKSDLVFNFCSIIAMELHARGSNNVYTMGPSPWRKLLPERQVESLEFLSGIFDEKVVTVKIEAILPWCFYAASHGYDFQLIHFDEVAQRWQYRGSSTSTN